LILSGSLTDYETKIYIYITRHKTWAMTHQIKWTQNTRVKNAKKDVYMAQWKIKMTGESELMMNAGYV
jgi:hypothetical protein